MSRTKYERGYWYAVVKQEMKGNFIGHSRTSVSVRPCVARQKGVVFAVGIREQHTFNEVKVNCPKTENAA